MAKRFRRVAVLKGGPSTERDVSLRSGAAVALGLRQAGYDVTEVDVTGRTLTLPPGCEAAFIALHGEFGEDGQVQELLEAQKVPYTGSGPASSRAAFDKRLSKEVFLREGIPTPSSQLLRRGVARSVEFPLVVKPPCQGSTIGIHRVRSEAEWLPAIEDAFRYGDELLIETFIPGRELTAGVVGDEALPVVEIVVDEGWYDYRAKYQSQGQTQYRVPAPLAGEVTARCQSIALATFRALRCRGLGRVDFRLTADGGLWVLELNNLPGFTESSLLPKAAQAAGIPFPALCGRIMEMATLDTGG